MPYINTPKPPFANATREEIMQGLVMDASSIEREIAARPEFFDDPDSLERVERMLAALVFVIDKQKAPTDQAGA